MKSDRELLELAARAAGIDIQWYSDECCLAGVNEDGDPTIWNPLTSDADALRLAVKLGMQIDIDDAEKRTYILGRAFADEPHGTDPYAATRRAIVRASAAIGEGK